MPHYGEPYFSVFPSPFVGAYLSCKLICDICFIFQLSHALCERYNLGPPAVSNEIPGWLRCRTWSLNAELEMRATRGFPMLPRSTSVHRALGSSAVPFSLFNAGTLYLWIRSPPTIPPLPAAFSG